MNPVRPGTEIRPTTVAVLVLTILLSTAVPVKPGEEGGTRVKGFTLHRYGEDNLFWELSGGRASEEGGDLLVDDFILAIKTSGEKEETVYEISGRRIKIEKRGGGRVGTTLGETDILIGGEVEVVAVDVKYDFGTGEIEGSSLQMTAPREGGRLKMKGDDFEYTYDQERLALVGGFSVTVVDEEGGSSQISGEELTWVPGEELRMSGSVTAELESGWDLTAEEMTWFPGQDRFTASGRVRAVKDGATLTGSSLDYEAGSEEITVVSARLTLDD